MYAALVTDNNNCTVSTVTIQINPVPLIPAGQSFQITPGQTLVMDPQVSGDIAGYSWSPAYGLSSDTIRSPVANPSQTTTYTLRVSSTDGCVATANIIVKVFSQIKLPNAFTPNGDGKNDIFYIPGGLEGMTVKNFSIFNRWGERIFEVNDALPGDPGFGWNGNYKGSPAPAGAYVYIITLKSADNSTQVYKGTVVLIR